MKANFLLLCAALLASSCQKNEHPTPTPGAEDPDWVKLRIPTPWDGDEAYSVIGDLDKTLLVATTERLSATSDQGKTWRTLKVFSRPTYGLLLRNDTLFALSARATTPQGQSVATVADQFSTDFGQTWAYPVDANYYRLRAISQPFGQVGAVGISYEIRENAVPISGQANSTALLATDLLRTDAAGQVQTLRLPARHYLKNLALDAQHRLYVTASGLRFDDRTGTVYDPAKSEKSAVVYVSRRPLP
ncbi:hypothetical protein GCM10028824_36490 [Hymenobacter segetis]|uniref:Exo-alpha-sialidase n=1 Tax=Hymenobacter segetis TaxID=2025509 RepID=A0ABU9M1I6_9BACT